MAAAHSTPDRSSVVVAGATITWALAVIVTGLRFMSRKLQRNTLWIDDLCIVLALFWATAHTFTMAIYEVQHGLGKHIHDAPADALYAFNLGFFLGEVVYIPGLTLVKWAILAFYWRIFNTLGSISRPIWILFAMVCMWSVASLLATILQCLPVNAYWTRYDPVNPLPASEYHCGVNDDLLFYGNAIPNIVIDILLIGLPIPYIRKLQLARPQKLGLVGVFLVGALVCIISFIRFYYVSKLDPTSTDLTWEFVDLLTWSVAEENLAIVCACLPSLKPLLDLALNGTIRTRSHPTKGSSGFTRAGNEHAEGQSGTMPRSVVTDVEDGFPVPPGVKTMVSDRDTDEHPFVWATDNDSDQSINVAKGTPAEAMELKEMPSQAKEAQ